eukprot:450746_1
MKYRSIDWQVLFDEKSQQKKVYVDCVKPLVSSFLEGYNATVIAYGQTGSGKTYTMGTLGCDDSKLQEEWGVIPSAIHDIFDTLSRRTNNDYKVQCSFIEIYNEEIKDLLDPHSSKQLAIRENAEGPSKIHIPNMKLETVQNAMDCAEALDRGGASRATAYTLMNATSSRSHAIFTVHLHHIKANKENTDGEPVVIQSKFHFVDLAGSERAKKTGASGTRLAEGISINAGLLALGNVIAALGDPRLKSKHVPFRDSKITRLLQDSLGGNSRTLMIACISPARSNMLETKNTLNYANRAKNIKNKAVVNRDPRSRQILELRQRVKELERQLKHGGERKQLNQASMVPSDEYEQQIEQISQLQSDLSDSNNEVVKLQEKVKGLRVNLSELQDKYYDEVGAAKTDLSMERRKRMELLDQIRAKYPAVEVSSDHKFDSLEEQEMRDQIQTLERLKLENEGIKKENCRLQKTIISNETRDQNFVHNLHDQMAKLVRGDFSLMNENLISPSKRFDVSSSTSSISSLLLVDDEEDEDDEEDTEEEEDHEEEHMMVEAENDDDNDVSMSDPKTEKMKRENSEQVKETSTERQALKREKQESIVYKKKLLKEQKCHDKQMEFIAHEQVSRERSQRLKSEKYNREIDRTNRDITNLQALLKQLRQQRQSDIGKQAYYEKQVNTLSQELDEAHHQGQLYEVEKAKLNPNDIKKLQAQEMKISNYQNKVKSLTLQIRSYRDKLGQIRRLQTLHKEDMLKVSQMTRKLSDLKRKKVNLQRKLKEENKAYARWKQETEKTIKQLRKVQREKNIQIQRHKSALSKTTSALKLKTAALMHLKKKQREMVSQLQNRRNSCNRHARMSRGRRNGKNKRSSKQLKSKIAALLQSLIIKHQLFNKYKLFDREYKSLQHAMKEAERGQNGVMRVLNQNLDEEESQRLNTEKLEYEQQIEDTQSTIKYIREQMISMSHQMKENDNKRWKQLKNAQKVSLQCTETDLDKYLNIANIPYARQCINFLINQHLRFRLIIDDYKKQTKHLKAEINKILSNADNEMRKKMVLIEKLQNNLNEERAKHRFEQRKGLNDEEEEEKQPDNAMHIDNDTDCDDDDDDDLDLETDLESDLKRKQNELNQHRKLLNMYCSPHPPATKAATVDSLSSTSTRSSNEQQRQVQLELGNNGISVQLTPFHTPIVKSKTKSIQPPIQNESFFNQHSSERSITHSPLYAQPGHHHEQQLQSIHEENNNKQSNNVFSRLTNPKHFIGTSRTRAQELQALKQKVKKQKVSHTQIAHKRAYLQKNKKTYQSPPISVHYEEMSFDANDSSVFDRLHTTSIRNTRCMDESLLHEGASRLNCNSNEMAKKPQRNLHNQNAASKSMLVNPPVRVLTPDNDS